MVSDLPTTSDDTPEEPVEDGPGHQGPFELRIVEPGVAKRRWHFQGNRFSIGSHPSNELVLKDPAVSRFHCEVSAHEDVVTIRDLDSRNGTLVDGVRVRDAFLRSGAHVQLGRVFIRFGGAPAAPAPAQSVEESFGGLVGRSPAMRAVFSILERAAQRQTTVLLEGETGTGKGEAALALHRAGERQGKPFVVIDCGSIPENLFESELFGSERGAFTGADAQRIGAFESATGGTIFLDEVGELPLEVQPKLLRALEERQIRRLGSTRMRPIDVRVIAASNRDLRAAVNDGSFRADLYYRLAVVRACLPPLRERVEDLPLLATRLLTALGATPEQLAALSTLAFLAALRRNPWRGNVRELRNYLERCLVLDQPPEDLEASLSGTTVLGTFQDGRGRALASFERHYLETLMAQHDGKVAPAAEAAGLSRVYLYRLLAKYRLLGRPRGA